DRCRADYRGCHRLWLEAQIGGEVAPRRFIGQQGLLAEHSTQFFEVAGIQHVSRSSPRGGYMQQYCMQFISIALRVGQQDLTVKPVKIFEHALFYLSLAFCTALLAIVWLVFACKKNGAIPGARHTGL